ncbi:MAG: FAD/NAD(P)-binding oxidoreductase [Deltaproteobacteria bacterium CG03_land_8_20_14_0_80_45_14]|nr:MAG: FAD/NAD(P)-binding oxidoreductase [Deltaproteobacteria bacterium CG03_land_8_20_14_0_80_45_14]
MGQMETEVLIIGGGVLGAVVARELSRYKVDVILVEKEADFGWGSTKTNMCIVCQGADTLEFRPEYHRSKLVWDSMPLTEPLCQEIDVPFKRVGELALIRNNEELSKFQKLKSRAEKIGIGSHKFLDQETLRQMEPHVTRQAIGALYDPNIAIVDPVRLTIALVENAGQNGVKVMRETEVLGISQKVNEFEVETNRGPIKCRFIVNAAGTSVDRIARLVNSDDFVLYPIRGYVGIFDKNLGGLIEHEIHMRPDAPGQMNIITPSVHGNLFFGTTMQPARRGDYSTTRRIAQIGLQNVRKIIPDLSEKDIINSFAGFLMFRNWEVGWHECVVQASLKVPRFISICIGYPGVSAAPATAREVTELLRREGLRLETNPGFSPFRKAPPVFNKLSEEEQMELVTKDPGYGHVVCRCETVTEGEIVEALRHGATTLDGIKFRTRAGMGRCQGGFCTPRVVKILARELGIPEEKITKKGRESRILLYKTKELLGAEL